MDSAGLYLPIRSIRLHHNSPILQTSCDSESDWWCLFFRRKTSEENGFKVFIVYMWHLVVDRRYCSFMCCFLPAGMDSPFPFCPSNSTDLVSVLCHVTSHWDHEVRESAACWDWRILKTQLQVKLLSSTSDLVCLKCIHLESESVAAASITHTSLPHVCQRRRCIVM